MDLRPFEAILLHQELSASALVAAQAAALNSAGRVQLPVELQSLSDADLIDAFGRARDQAEGGAVVALLGVVEATLRRDLAMRKRHRKLDRAARLLHQPGLVGERVKLDTLIDAWRAVTGETGHGAGSKLKHALQLRHWLAHGRAWRQPQALSQTVDIDATWSAAEAFLLRVHQHDPAFPL